MCMLHKFSPLSFWGSLSWKTLKCKGSAHVSSSNLQTIIQRSWVNNNGSKEVRTALRSSSWTWGRTSSLWGWRSPGPGCPGRLWSLLLWRYSRPAWTRSSTAYCRWPCLGRRVGLDDPQRSLPTPTILWFCESWKMTWNYWCIPVIRVLWLQSQWTTHQGEWDYTNRWNIFKIYI